MKHYNSAAPPIQNCICAACNFSLPACNVTHSPPLPPLNPLKSSMVGPRRLCGHILAVAVTHNALLNMLPNQAAKPCVHIGFEVANRMKSKEHYEQHKKKVTVVFIVLFLQIFVIELYAADVSKKFLADQFADNDLLSVLFGK